MRQWCIREGKRENEIRLEMNNLRKRKYFSFCSSFVGYCAPALRHPLLQKLVSLLRKHPWAQGPKESPNKSSRPWRGAAGRNEKPSTHYLSWTALSRLILFALVLSLIFFGFHHCRQYLWFHSAGLLLRLLYSGDGLPFSHCFTRFSRICDWRGGRRDEHWKDFFHAS